MPGSETKVFVSYSRADACLIAPIVKLLKANRSLVFQDIADIRPGKKWRNEIDAGLAASQLVVVFWCDHANESTQVSKEWRTALDQEKDVLPLLLDATPLPPELSEYQWIDFRETVGTNHGSDTVSAPSVNPPAPRSPGWNLTHVLSLAGAATLLVAVVVGGMFTLDQTVAPTLNQPASPVPTPSQPTPPAPGPPGSPGLTTWLPLLLAIGVLGVVWLWRRVAGQTASVEVPRSPREYERRMARQIEAEIVQRTTGTPSGSDRDEVT